VLRALVQALEDLAIEGVDRRAMTGKVLGAGIRLGLRRIGSTRGCRPRRDGP
jgi:hypothetical protein